MLDISLVLKDLPAIIKVNLQLVTDGHMVQLQS
jgi:hypothetical protein